MARKGHPGLIVTERALREQVRDASRLFGWLFYFTWTSLHSPAGFPDLVLVHPGKRRIIYAELKTTRGTVTERQQVWLDALAAAGGEVYVWRPDDFDEIVRVLQ